MDEDKGQDALSFVMECLGKANAKEVERATGIPADRIYKWLKGKGKPKTEDLSDLLKYFGGGIYSDNFPIAGKPEELEELIPQSDLVILLKEKIRERNDLYEKLLDEKDKRLSEKDYVIELLKEKLDIKSKEKSNTDSDVRSI